MWLLLPLAFAQAPDAQAPNPAGPTPAAPTVSLAAPLPDTLPPELVPWLDWVASRTPERACALVGERPLCTWPGTLSLDADGEGANFSLALRLDQDGLVSLPGGRGAWPESVRTAAGPVVVREREGRPVAELNAGTWLITGRYRWSALPQGINFPDDIGLVALSVNGGAVAQPRIDSGVLRLGAGQGAEGEGRVDMDVARRLHDGVPVVVETHLKIRVSGSSRELDLGEVLLPNTRVSSLDSPLPARFGADGHLVVQLRPGTWSLSFTALHDGPADHFTSVDPPAPWPDVEFWAFSADEVVRSVSLSGPPSVDPARTPMPETWRGMPSFRVTPGEVLRVDELRRGEPEAPPNQLSLQRELWVDFDGGGLTARDTFSGAMEQGWRLDLVGDGAQLGHAADAGQDQIITQSAVGAGIELRNRDVQLVAESRWQGGLGDLPAVGWASDVSELNTRLYLPPGWRLLAAPGVDTAATVLDSWELVEVALALGLAGAVGWLCGPGWGLGLLLGLLGSVHAAATPMVVWLLPVGAALLARLWPKWPTRFLIFPVALMLGLGLYDDARPAWAGTGVATGRLDRSGYYDRAVKLQSGRGSYSKNLSAWVDPNAVAQTGPGIPSWSGASVSLQWDGPVRADHRYRLILLPSGPGRILRLLVTFLLAAVLLRLVRAAISAAPPPPGPASPGAAAPAGVGAVLLLAGALLPQPAWAAPSPEVLAELTARLDAGLCTRDCVTVPTVRLEIRGEQLVVDAEVHSSGHAAWALPGPADTWAPQRVLIDGAAAAGMVRRPDAFVYLRVDPGVHQVRLEGSLRELSALTLQFPTPPQKVEVSADGWAVEGIRDDGSTEGAISVLRSASGGTRDELTPWLSVVRFLDLGLPWRVRTELRRNGPGERPLTLKIPLLPGEAVIDEGLAVKDGAVTVSLGRDVSSVSWTSTLEMREVLVLTAPSEVPWTELWQVACSPVFSCKSSGPPVLSRIDEGVWSPSWRPWPGESLTLEVSRPEAAAGQTLTVDQVSVSYDHGPRLVQASVSLQARSSQGGRLSLTLPEGARVTGLQVDGVARPLRADGRQVDLPLRPGAQQLKLAFEQPFTPSFFLRAPELTLGSPAVNVQVSLTPPPGWGPVWAFGPGLGARVPGWYDAALLALVAWWGVGRLPARLGLHRALTMLLTFGFAWVSPTLLVPLVFGVGGLWLSGSLGRLGQVTMWLLGGGSLLLGLGAPVLLGLLGSMPTVLADGPDPGSAVWLVDRSDGALPTPGMWLIPLWVWRAAVLACGLAAGAWIYRLGRAVLAQYAAGPAPGEG